MVERARFDIRLTGEELRILKEIPGGRFDRLMYSDSEVILIAQERSYFFGLNAVDVADQNVGVEEGIRIEVQRFEPGKHAKYMDKNYRDANLRPVNISQNITKIEVLHGYMTYTEPKSTNPTAGKGRQSVSYGSVWLDPADSTVKALPRVSFAEDEESWPEKAVLDLDFGIVLYFEAMEPFCIASSGSRFAFENAPFAQWQKTHVDTRFETISIVH